MNSNQSGKHESHNRKIRLWLIAVLACTLVFGLAVLIRYGSELASEKKTEADLQEIYYGSNAADPQAEEQETFRSETASVNANNLTLHEAEEQEPEISPEAAAAEPETAAPDASVPEPGDPEASLTAGKLPAVPYPDNLKRTISSRFRELRKQNRDIVGWLKLDKLLDQAVVQRDHIFYMDHDVKKAENRNGALFLDAAVSLKTRPYTILIYGHNMKSGAMFGCLRNYENLKYYRKSPFASFDSLYEEGRYVIFAAGSIGITESEDNYIGVFTMLSERIEERQQLIRALNEASVWKSGIDVQPEDQLLLLVTCVDSDNRRRIVAARRLRDGETEQELKAIIANSR